MKILAPILNPTLKGRLVDLNTTLNIVFFLSYLPSENFIHEYHVYIIPLPWSPYSGSSCLPIPYHVYDPSCLTVIITTLTLIATCVLLYRCES